MVSNPKNTMLTYTLQSRSVQRTAHWTQTHKGSYAVLTFSINTGARETLIDICYKTTRFFFQPDIDEATFHNATE